MAIALRRPSPGVISSPFGMRAGGLHEGIDFGWGNGWTIYAAASGVVRWAAPGAGYGARYGNLTIIDHGGFETRYAHQSQMWVRPGYKVSAGEAIGLKGGSGDRGLNTYDPHLHFELLIGGKRVNPAPYFTSTAGGGGTPIPVPTPKPKEEDDMEFRYFTRKNPTTKKDEWAITHPLHFKDGVFVTNDIALANGFAPFTGNSMALNEAGRWDGMLKTAKLAYDAAWAAEERKAKLAATVVIDYAELGKALALAVSANAPVPSAQQIAKAVNDDAAERLRN